MRKLFAVAAVLAMSTGTTSAQPFSFEYMPNDLVPTVFGAVSWADADLDGRLDIAVTGSTTHEAPYEPVSTLYLQREQSGDGDSRRQHFEALQLPVSLWHSASAWNDFDRDGDPDLVILGAESADQPYAGRTVLLMNDGAGNLSLADVDLPPLFSGSADWGDYDNDGDADLLLTGVSGNVFTTALMRNDDGSFTQVDAGLTEVGYGAARFGDYDGDRDLDIVLTGQAMDGYFTKIYNNSGGAFTEVTVSESFGLAYSDAAWGDYDADGDLDVLLAGGQISELLYSGQTFLLSNRDGAFRREDLTEDGMLGGSVAWGDVDLDGDLDAFASGAYYLAGPRAARVFLNDEGILEAGINLPGTLYGKAALGDHDSDGDLDLVMSGVSASQTDITNLYVNTQRLLNDPPSVPAELSSSVEDGRVTLAWSASTDDRLGTVTYNLRVGTSEEGIDIVSPNAVISTGHRLVDGFGNVFQNEGWVLLGLSPGTYWWSVQAIDGAFASSAFSTPQSFSIPTD